MRMFLARPNSGVRTGISALSAENDQLRIYTLSTLLNTHNFFLNKLARFLLWTRVCHRHTLGAVTNLHLSLRLDESCANTCPLSSHDRGGINNGSTVPSDNDNTGIGQNIVHGVFSCSKGRWKHGTSPCMCNDAHAHFLKS